MNEPFAQLLDSPLLVDFHNQVGRKLDAERAARQRFRARPDTATPAEFINGEVVEKVPTQKRHFRIMCRFESLINAWATPRELGTVGREEALTEFPRNDYCPDLCFWTPDRLPLDADETTTVFPPPTFAIEVLSPSTARRDRGVKFEDYQAHGVREYWIVDPDRRAIEQYVEQDGKYALVPPAADGVVRSAVIAGFQMPVEAAFDDAAQMVALRDLMRAP